MNIHSNEIMNKFGFTEYFGGVLRIQLLKYDNNKYVTGTLPDGTSCSLKRGYIYADVALTRSIPAVDWFTLGGGVRRDFRSYKKKTVYFVRVGGGADLIFSSKAGAVALASSLAKARLVDIEIFSRVTIDRGAKGGSSSPGVRIVCDKNGFAIQTDGRRRGTSKYLRGYGKIRTPQ